jgi:pimeloyl-ACP methyl ester carboxylesterase
MASHPAGRRQSAVSGVGHFVSDAARDQFVSAYAAAMAALPHPRESLDVPTGFGTVRVYRFGQDAGVPLLLLPGRAASTPMWEPNLAGLAARRPVFTVDLLGEPGMSVQTRPIAGAADQAAWLDEVLQALMLAHVHLVGVSIGGWTAMNQALHAPQRIASLILIDPVSVFARFSAKAIVFSLGATLPGLPEGWRMRMLSWISGGAETGDEPVAHLISAGMRGFKLHLPAPTYPSDEQLRKVTTPTLAIMAGRSIVHDAKRAAARARRLLPDARVECWPEASHAINGEYSEQVVARALEFVDSVDERPVKGPAHAG